MEYLPKFPDWLPRPLQDGYGFEPVSPLISTNMQGGGTIQRRRYRSTPTNGTLTWGYLNDKEANFLMAWVQDVIKDGQLWFEIDLKTPEGDFAYACQLRDMYQGPTLMDAVFWGFSVPVRLKRRPVISGGWALYYPEALRYPDIIDIALNQKWPAA
jgi:hypothetical protein